MVNTRLNWFLENFELICQKQADFRRNCLTANQVAYFSQAIKDAFYNSEVLAAVFVDCKSAYDSV